MNQAIDQEARKHLAGLVRRFAAGAITNEQFENAQPCSKGTPEQVLRQAQDERPVVDFARGELVEPQVKSPCSELPKEPALQDIINYGLWPLYDDFVQHKLIGRWALTPEGKTWVARIVLFLHSGLPYRYPQLTGFAQVPVILLSLFTLGWFGRFWRRRKWRGGDQSVWPFYSRSEYEAALKNPVFLNGCPQQRVQGGRA
jgi:hypothetical protein